MKNSGVQLGGTYTAKVSNKMVSVRIDAENRHGGWSATNLMTGKTIRIKSAQRLRKRQDNAALVATSTEDAASDAQSENKRDTGQRGATGGQPGGDTVATAKAMSLVDAAAHLLWLGNGEPMRCREIVDLVVQHQLWRPGRGRTPASTLYAAILREMAIKGTQCRFVKTERGKFALRDRQK